MSYIDSNSFRNIKWEELEEFPYAFECFQKAILTQAMYVFRNTDLALDSGYDPDSGFVASKEQIQSVVISEATLNFLRQGGLFNQVIDNHRRYLDFK
jgi:hypothetical protein